MRSNDNTERVREWLESCLKNHGACRAADNEAVVLRTRPDRILAIDGDRVKLVCNWSESSGSKYFALSHMWGIDPKQQLRLVLSRLDEFQKEISWTASKTHFSAVRSASLPATTMDAQLEFMEDWERLIYHYRARVLTQSQDRIMAFAGIAQATHDSNRMAYMAGSWAQIFPFSFTWSVDLPTHLNPRTKVVADDVREAVTNAAPSWSWFSIPIFSRHLLGFPLNIFMRHKLAQSKNHRIEPMYQATLISLGDRLQQAYSDPATTKAFHNFTGMILNLVLKTCSGFLRHPTEPDIHYETITRQFERLTGGYGTFQYYLDRPDKLHNHSEKVTLGLLLELHAGFESELDPAHRGRFLVGLLMQAESSCEAHRPMDHEITI